jgi:iron(III) transport system permease protein
MAVLIAATSAVVTLLYMVLGKWVERRTQRWRNPSR